MTDTYMKKKETGTVCILTIAYNAEKTIQRTIDSILRQTYTNILYYICENGSTDRTREIIKTYSESDDRVVLILRDVNHTVDNSGSPLISFMSSITSKNEYEFFCLLDSDDEYTTDYLEKMLAFMEENELDIGACGNDFIDEKTNNLMSVRKLSSNLILDNPSAFNYSFTQYHQFMRTVWCKIYRISLLKECDYLNYNEITKVAYGSDTLFAMRAFLLAKRMGIYSESLHKYYLNPKTDSNKWSNKRIASDRILDDTARSFLIEKCGEIIPQNDRFLQLVYFNAVCDTLRVLLLTDLQYSEKLQNLREIITHSKTQSLFHNRNVRDWELNRKIRDPLKNWFLSQKELRMNKNSSNATAELFIAMYSDLPCLISVECLSYVIWRIPELVEILVNKEYLQIIDRLNQWYKSYGSDYPLLTELELNISKAMGKNDDELFSLLIEIKNKRQLSAKKIDVVTQITELMMKYPLLKNVSTGLATLFSHTVRWILRENYIKALDDFIEVSKSAEISDSDADAYILLGVNLSAVTENADAYIHFKKIWISFLLNNARYSEAHMELDDMLGILPDDEDLKALGRFI